MEQIAIHSYRGRLKIKKKILINKRKGAKMIESA